MFLALFHSCCVFFSDAIDVETNIVTVATVTKNFKIGGDDMNYTRENWKPSDIELQTCVVNVGFNDVDVDVNVVEKILLLGVFKDHLRISFWPKLVP